MPYATYSDLLRNFGETELEHVLDRDRDGMPDSGVMQDGLDFADDLIDGYLRERYTVPLTPPPANLISIACDLARYRYYQDQPTELVQLRYDAAIAYLRDVARGLVSLAVDASNESATMAYSQPTPIFTRLVW
jgi:phage gp36-like protein